MYFSEFNSRGVNRSVLPTRKDHGFSMIELVIVIAVIAILSALIAPLAVNQIEQSRYDAAKEELDIIKTAIVGDPSLIEGGTRSSFGFVGDLGNLPATLDQLTAQSGLPNYSQYMTTPMFWGWRGPYITEYMDPWGQVYEYVQRIATVDDKRIAFVWSRGPDRQTADPWLTGDSRNDDNITVSIYQDQAFVMVSGNTLDPCDAGSPFTNITVTYPDGGGVVSTINPKATTAINPMYLIPLADTTAGRGIPIGIRLINYTTATPSTVQRLLQVNNGPMVTSNLKDPGVCN